MEAKSAVRSILGECETYSDQGQTDSNIAPPSPASARTMSISELRWKIFQLVDLEFSRRKTLLALALTCKSFTGPALDLVWRELIGLGPLIRCLPPTLWKLEKEKAGLKLEFQRAMTLEDWSIFCKYNHRVRSLHMSRWAYKIGPEILSAIACPPFALPLLPNLTSLTWNASSVAFPCIRLFVTQGLTRLHINVHPEFKFSLSVQSTLSCIPMLCPSVSHFEFSGGLESGGASVAFQCWSQLISARTGKISDAAILHLSKLPSLQTLYLGLCSTPISPNTQKLLQRPVFCALHLLNVECETLALLDAFFETLSIAPKKLSFNIAYGVAQVLPASISRLSNACAHSALERFQIVVKDSGATPDTSISAAVFQPLCTFRNLRELDFDVQFDVQFDDTIFLQMAKAWPLLEVLWIHGEYSPSSANNINITTNSFVSLLQHCPHLTSIGIAVDWSTVDQPDISPEIPYQGFAHKALSYANFGSSKIHHAIGVAAFISAIAPNMKTFSAWNDDWHPEIPDHPDFEEYSSTWEHAKDLVKAFSVVREQERRMRKTVGGDGGVEDNYRTGEAESPSSMFGEE